MLLFQAINAVSRADTGVQDHLCRNKREVGPRRQEELVMVYTPESGRDIGMTSGKDARFRRRPALWQHSQVTRIVSGRRHLQSGIAQTGRIKHGTMSQTPRKFVRFHVLQRRSNMIMARTPGTRLFVTEEVFAVCDREAAAAYGVKPHQLSKQKQVEVHTVKAYTTGVRDQQNCATSQLEQIRCSWPACPPSLAVNDALIGGKEVSSNQRWAPAR